MKILSSAIYIQAHYRHLDDHQQVICRYALILYRCFVSFFHFSEWISYWPKSLKDFRNFYLCISKCNSALKTGIRVWFESLDCSFPSHSYKNIQISYLSKITDFSNIKLSSTSKFFLDFKRSHQTYSDLENQLLEAILYAMISR